MRTAVYAGSFDPPTLGHEWVIKAGSRQYDRLIVLVSTNTEKYSLFSEKEKVEMLSEMCRKLSNIEVKLLGNVYLADYARTVGALWTLRGMRDIFDYQYEVRMRDRNNKINPDLETVLVFQPEELRGISSSFIKSLVGSDGWETVVKTDLPDCVYHKFVEKYKIMEKIKKLKAIWLKLCHQLGARGDIEDVFEEIVARYSESHRHYHGLDHILDCLEKFDQVRHFVNKPLVLEMAIWTHDIVYDARLNANNEERSAELSDELLTKLHLGPLFITEVKERIMPTKHTYIPTGKDDCLIVDIDLASLALPPEEFDKMSEKIRLEYNAPVEIYPIERAKFFAKLMKGRPSIYLTEYFRSRYETQAQENLKRAIAVLDN